MSTPRKSVSNVSRFVHNFRATNGVHASTAFLVCRGNSNSSQFNNLCAAHSFGKSFSIAHTRSIHWAREGSAAMARLIINSVFISHLEKLVIHANDARHQLAPLTKFRHRQSSFVGYRRQMIDAGSENYSREMIAVRIFCLRVVFVAN